MKLGNKASTIPWQDTELYFQLYAIYMLSFENEENFRTIKNSIFLDNLTSYWDNLIDGSLVLRNFSSARERNIIKNNNTPHNKIDILFDECWVQMQMSAKNLMNASEQF